MPSRSISAAIIRECALGADHPDLATSLNNLASLYQAEGRTADALPIVERTIASGRAQLRLALPVLFAAQRQQLLASEKALDDALNAVQRGTQSSAASAVNKLAVRLAAGSDRLAQLVRRDQDLASEAETLDKAPRFPRSGRSATQPVNSAAGSALRSSRPNARACKKLLPRNSPTTRRSLIRCR